MLNELVLFFLNKSTDITDFDYMLCLVILVLLFDGFCALIGIIKGAVK